jgi:hypothetical protein
VERGALKEATWPSAWTPVSVRPEPCRLIFCAPDFFQRGFDAFLHGPFGGLALPAGKIGAAIGDGQLVALQRRVEAMGPALGQLNDVGDGVMRRAAKERKILASR